MNPDPYEVNVAKEWARKWFPIAVVFAVAAGLIGLLFLIPAGHADAAVKPKPKIVSTINYGSGLWTGTTSPVVRTGDPATADYTLFGDSIVVRCTADIRTALTAKGKTLATIAQSSQNAGGLVDLLIAEPSISGKVVMEAGTNSVFDPLSMPAQIARAKATGHELYWGDTYVGRPATINADLRNSGWVNNYIYSAIPFDHVIKWQPALGAAVGRGGGSDDMINNYLQDGVHPWLNAGTGHGDGCAFFAAVYVAGLGL